MDDVRSRRLRVGRRLLTRRNAEVSELKRVRARVRPEQPSALRLARTRSWLEAAVSRDARIPATERSTNLESRVAVCLGDNQSAMSEEGVAVVRGMWEAFIGNDAATALAAFDPDVEWDGTNLPDGKVSHGLEAVMDHAARWAEMWETWEVELEDVIDAGEDRVIAFIRERGRSKVGLEANERHSELYVVRDGKIVYRKGFSDADEALVEAGFGNPDRVRGTRATGGR